MDVLLYNGYAFRDLVSARAAARVTLNRNLGAEGRDIDYEWKPDPIVSLDVRGIIWRGYCTYASVCFSADIVERRID